MAGRRPLPVPGRAPALVSLGGPAVVAERLLPRRGIIPVGTTSPDRAILAAWPAVQAWAVTSVRTRLAGMPGVPVLAGLPAGFPAPADLGLPARARFTARRVLPVVAAATVNVPPLR